MKKYILRRCIIYTLGICLVTFAPGFGQMVKMKTTPDGQAEQVPQATKRDTNRKHIPLTGLNPFETITRAFQNTSLVALGETHDIREMQNFYLDLLDHKPFVEAVNDLVLEEGNPLHQNLLDKFVYGGNVSMDELEKVWQDGTHSIVNTDSKEALKALLIKVRNINKDLPEDKKIRVLGGDSPIDWDQINNQKDWSIMLSRRDRYYYTTVWDEVLDKGRKALMIMGSSHFKRIAPNPPAINLIRALDTRIQHLNQKVFVIHMYDRGPINEVEMTKPFISMIKNTRIGDERHEPGHPDIRYEDQVDAILFHGNGNELTRIIKEPASEEWMEILNKRNLRVTGAATFYFITEAIITKINTEGKEATKKWFDNVVQEKPDKYAYDHRLFIMTGHEYLQRNDTETAVFIFELGAQMYPNEWNIHDSLAEGYHKNGQKELAIKHYNKSLQLNPDNNNAVEKLKEIKGG